MFEHLDGFPAIPHGQQSIGFKCFVHPFSRKHPSDALPKQGAAKISSIYGLLGQQSDNDYISI